MRRAALILALLLVQPLAAAAQGDPFAAFDRAVADAKSAMMGDPQQALAKSQLVMDRARALPPSPRAEIAWATALWLQAEANIGSNRLEQAPPLIDAGLAAIERAAPRSKLHGDLLRSRGAVAAMSGRAQQALADFQRAYQAFRAAGEVRGQALALQDIGLIYWDAGDYPRTLQYYQQAGDLYDDDPAFTLTSHNNRGEVLAKMRRPIEAEKEFRAALMQARTLKSGLLEVRILSNLASVQTESRRLAAARQSIDRAMVLAGRGEAAGWAPFVLGVAAKVAAAQGDQITAGRLIERTFAGADIATTPLPFREVHETAAAVYDRLGQPALALAHLRAFQRLDSEARNLVASTSSQLMAARFDFANQNLRISSLKQGQLERDVKLERQRSAYRTTLFGALAVAGSVVLGLLGFGYFSIRRSRNAVRETNAELTQVNGKLEKALKAKTEFLATTSHEIRTPLNGILGVTQVLLANRRIEAEVREQVELVHGAGETMRALVDDILDVAKMETGEVAVVQEETELRRILEEAARLWSGHARGKGLALEADLARAPRLIRSDATRIRQIVFNLLSNAIKFTPEGVVALSAWTEGEQDEERLVVQVRDSGIGIPDDQQQLIFEAFHQVDGGTTRQFGGTGLGLAICRNLAVALGGTIRLDSVAGEGSTFTLTLPIERLDTAGAVDERPAERPTSLGAARLLLLEANVMVQGAMCGLLEPAVGSMSCVESRADAEAELAAGRADLLLIEPKGLLADEAGPIGALRLLVAAGEACGVPTTILFAPSEALPLAEVAQIGAAQVVVKPAGGAQLIAALHGLFDAAADAEPPASTAAAA